MKSQSGYTFCNSAVLFSLYDPNSSNWECLEKTEPDPSERYTAEGWKAIETIRNTRELWLWQQEKNNYQECDEALKQVPREAVGSPSLEILKTHLDEALSNLLLLDLIQAVASSGPFPIPSSLWLCHEAC